MQHRLFLPAIALFAGGALAQTNLGILQNVDASYVSRGDSWNAGAFPSIQWTRIDSDFLAGWGYDDSNPGFRTFFGVHCFLQDNNGATADPFQLVVYTEGATVAMPDVVSPVLTTGSMSMPVGAPGVAAYEVTTFFLTPIAAPAAADVFVGVHQLTPSNVLAQDGMFVRLTTAEASPGLWTVRDVPGAGASSPAAGAQQTYAGYHVPAATQTAWMPRSQFHIEPILLTAGGVASAQHFADPLHPASGLAPGTSCLLSGIRPDARSPAANPGRADDLGMTLVKTGLPDNSPILFLGDISGGLAPETPLAWVLPGASGVTCINLGTVVVLGVGWSLNGRASRVIQFPAALRPNLANVSIVQQAVVFDPVVNTFVAGPCQLSAL